MAKKGKRVLNMQRRPSQKQPAQVQAEAQINGEGGSTTYYVHGPRGIHAQQENGEWKWMAQDGLDSVRSVVDNELAVQQSITYDPFGNPIDVAGSEQTMYGYTGEPTDENGLVYLRERYYSPNLGVFISQDPYEGSLNNPMSLNRYAYVQGNPVNMTDPSGMIPVQAINSMMQSNPLAFAQMMNAGVCIAQADPCAGYAGEAYTLCRQGVTPTPTITPFPGTPMPSTFHVPCNFTVGFLRIRQGPSVLSPTVSILNNPAGVEFQVSSFIPGDLQLGGTGWYYVNSLGGWVHDSNLSRGPSPCPRNPSLTTPTPGPITPTPGPDELDIVSRVINCEAASASFGVAGIAHAIYNRMTSGAAEWQNYRSAFSVIQNTGVDCYPTKYQSYERSTASDAAARWLLGMGPMPDGLNNPLVDIQGYYWLGVPNSVEILPGQTEVEAIFSYILSRPDLYNYSACGVNETNDARLARLRDRFVALDQPQNTSRQLRTIYFSLSPLCP